MMALHEDVIADLLPLYFSGEASAATRVLVDEYFRLHPEFADAMRSAMEDTVRVPVLAPEDPDQRTIANVRKHMRWRAVLIAVGIFFTMSCITFRYEHGRLEYFIWRDAPASAAIFAVIAAICWGALALLTRRSKAL